MFLLRDKEFQRNAKILAKELGDKIGKVHKRTHQNNEQLLHKEFKVQIQNLAIRRAKQVIPKMELEMSKLETDHQAVLNQVNKSEQEIMATAGPIQDQIEKLQ